VEAILAFPCDAQEKVGLGRAAPVPGAARTHGIRAEPPGNQGARIELLAGLSGTSATHGAGGAQGRHPPVRLQTERAGDAAGAAHTHLYRVRSAIVAPSAARARVVRRIDAPPTYRSSPRQQPRPTAGARNAEAMPAPARQSSAATPRGWYRTYDKFVRVEAVNKELQAIAYTHTKGPPCA
jgi:hypothetical protein